LHAFLQVKGLTGDCTATADKFSILLGAAEGDTAAPRRPTCFSEFRPVNYRLDCSVTATEPIF